MLKHARHIRQIRIDLPLKESRLYWFVERSHSEMDPWWDRLFDFLLTFTNNQSEWHIAPDGDSAYLQPELTRAQRADISNFVRTAPKDQIASHRSLKRAVEMTQAQEEGLELVCFSGDVSGLNS